jgi:hypothetical protein
MKDKVECHTRVRTSLIDCAKIIGRGSTRIMASEEGPAEASLSEAALLNHSGPPEPALQLQKRYGIVVLRLLMMVSWRVTYNWRLSLLNGLLAAASCPPSAAASLGVDSKLLLRMLL